MDVSIIVQIIEISHRSFFLFIINCSLLLFLFLFIIIFMYTFIVNSFSGRLSNFVGFYISPLLPIAVKLRVQRERQKRVLGLCPRALAP
nr:MAG TPA: hypothetical protein [Microviridae sp.]